MILGIMGLVIVALMFVFMALTLRNFKKGLKDKGKVLGIHHTYIHHTYIQSLWCAYNHCGVLTIIVVCIQ